MIHIVCFHEESKINIIETFIAPMGHLKGWNIPKDLALDRSAWKIAIRVSES